MPKYTIGFVIVAYEGLKVDWVAIITEFLKDAIESLAEGKQIMDEHHTMADIVQNPLTMINNYKMITTPKHKDPKKGLPKVNFLLKHLSYKQMVSNVVFMPCKT